MSFQPVLPTGGYAGWLFLERTLESQKSTFVRTGEVSRDLAYFRENIAAADTAEKLVDDRRLLKVALGAFGLDDDLNARAFILKVLEEGTLDKEAFANRLADKRYAEIARVFGYGDLGARTDLSSFANDIAARYEDRQFERAVGQVDESMRLALYFETALTDILEANTSEDARWFALMGTPPARAVIESALGLPKSLATLDIDQQLEAFKSRAARVFGTESLGGLTDETAREKAIRLYLVREEAASFASSAGSIALTLLQNATIRYP